MISAGVMTDRGVTASPSGFEPGFDAGALEEWKRARPARHAEMDEGAREAWREKESLIVAHFEKLLKRGVERGGHDLMVARSVSPVTVYRMDGTRVRMKLTTGPSGRTGMSISVGEIGE